MEPRGVVPDAAEEEGAVAQTAAWLREHRAELAGRVREPLTAEARGLVAELSVLALIEALEIAVRTRSPELFHGEVAWSKIWLAARGGRDRALLRHLEALRDVLRGEPSVGPGAATDAILDAAVATFTSLPVTIPSVVDPASPRATLVRAYLEALLGGDWRAAGRMIVEAAERGAAVESLYLDVLQVAQREIGRLWWHDQLSVAEEHYATAVTRQVIALLQPQVFAPKQRAWRGRRLVVASVAGESHELGARMVADLFELAGWDTSFLGADVPPADVVEALERRRADALALSASRTLRIPEVSELIADVRARPSLAGMIVLVGGHPFELAPGLWRHVGADGAARTAAEAVHLAEHLLAERARR